MPPGGRELIEDDFGIAVMSRYSAAEAFKIGYFCERRTGFHLHEDLCHVRVVDEDGEPVPDGEPGRLVITNLVNRGSVLLNYPIGDLGSVGPAECGCGRTFRMLSELEGRVEDVLTLPDGRSVHPRAVWQAFKDDEEVLQYQLVQHEPRPVRAQAHDARRGGVRSGAWSARGPSWRRCWARTPASRPSGRAPGSSATTASSGRCRPECPVSSGPARQMHPLGRERQRVARRPHRLDPAPADRAR